MNAFSEYSATDIIEQFAKSFRACCIDRVKTNLSDTKGALGNVHLPCGVRTVFVGRISFGGLFYAEGELQVDSVLYYFAILDKGFLPDHVDTSNAS